MCLLLERSGSGRMAGVYLYGEKAMSKHHYGAKGYHDGREGRSLRQPHDLLDYILTGLDTNKRYGREDREYREGYRQGEKDRKKKW